MSTFQERLKQAIGARGYEQSMRRSVQTVILYEAHRCIADKLPSLRPFQRKLAFFDQAMALVEGAGFLPHQREEIMWRTGTSREPMQPETAWKRMKLIEKEVEKVAEKARPLCVIGKSHDDVCNEFIQQQYEAVSGQRGKPYPPNWEHAHNNVIMAYRMYYRGAELDPTFPPPDAPKEIIVPAEKPKLRNDSSYYIAVNNGGMGSREGIMSDSVQREDDMALLADHLEPAEERRQVLQEVKEHLDLLKQFEGVISQQALNKRKRELFAALPAAPPSSASRGKQRKEGVVEASNKVARLGPGATQL